MNTTLVVVPRKSSDRLDSKQTVDSSQETHKEKDVGQDIDLYCQPLAFIISDRNQFVDQDGRLIRRVVSTSLGLFVQRWQRPPTDTK